MERPTKELAMQPGQGEAEALGRLGSTDEVRAHGHGGALRAESFGASVGPDICQPRAGYAAALVLNLDGDVVLAAHHDHLHRRESGGGRAAAPAVVVRVKADGRGARIFD
eukprot:scaffold144240_cov29-Tisochrysis_lutea.AAC.4